LRLLAAALLRAYISLQPAQRTTKPFLESPGSG